MPTRSTLLLVWMLASACATTSPAPSATPSAPPVAPGTHPQTEDQKTLYALGLSIGRSTSVFHLTREELEFVRAGLYAKVLDEQPAVPLEEYAPKIQQLASSRTEARASAMKEEGKAYLAKFATEPGAVRTETGLVYKELQPGTSASPVATDIVKVHYRGMFTDGKEFDSSYKRNEPATLPLNGVIRCWTEAVQKMKVGGKARIACPSDLAYGDRGAPPDVPGGATLVFDVELLDVTHAP